MKNPPVIQKTKGFTLIELLVVFAIISLLASVVFAALNITREKGRDSKRISTLSQFEKALALYYSDHGQYPDTSSCNAGNTNNWGGISCANCTAYATTTECGTSQTFQQALGPYFSGGGVPADGTSYWPADGGFLYIGDKNSYCMWNYRNIENMNSVPKAMRKVACTPINSAGNCPNTPTDTYTTHGQGWRNIAQVGAKCSP